MKHSWSRDSTGSSRSDKEIDILSIKEIDILSKSIDILLRLNMITIPNLHRGFTSTQFLN